MAKVGSGRMKGRFGYVYNFFIMFRETEGGFGPFYISNKFEKIIEKKVMEQKRKLEQYTPK